MSSPGFIPHPSSLIPFTMDKLTFQEIQTPLSAVRGIRLVDFDLGQLEQEVPPVSFPCILIGLGGSPVVANGQGVDQVALNITVRVAFRLYERTSSINADTYRDQALAHLDTLKDINAVVNGLSGTNFSALALTQYWSNEKRADIRVYQASYGCLLESSTTDSNGVPSSTTPNYVSWGDIPMNQPGLCLKEEIVGQTEGQVESILLTMPDR